MQTKLHIPPLRPELVSRPRLVEYFKAGLRSKLILVSAPAGFGKTTMVSEWASSSKIPVGWVSVDEGDNDITRFWSYFISSLQTLRADIGKAALSLLQTSQAPPIESILTTLINEMSEVTEEYALVLDDYHMIKDPAINDSLTFLINHLPPQAHLIIASRIDPPIPLAYLRAQNQLVEVRAADLRFIREEAAAFLNDIMNLGLSDENIAELESRTEGWIASLQLAALSIKGQKDVSAFIAAFNGSNRYVLDYLIEEVLRKQEAGTQSFLLETAVLDRFTADLCDAVALRDDSREILEHLEKSNLFVLPLDDERQWYRYHHLFADLLRNQLLQSQKGRLGELHLRASRWFEQEGLIDEAIGHALEAKDFERALNLIEPVAVITVMQSNCSTFLGWLEKLPRDLVVNRPWLCFAGAIANQLTGRRDAVEPLLRSAESAMSRAEEEQPEEVFPDHAKIRGYVITIRITRALFEGDLQRAIELCHESFKYLPEDALAARATVAGNLGIAYWRNGELPASRRYLEEAETLGQAGGNLYISLLAMSHLSEIHRIHGHLSQTAQKCREGLRLSAGWGGGELLPATGGVCLGIALVLYEWNNLDEALYHVSRGIELAQKAGDKSTLLLCYRILAWQNRMRENSADVREAIRRADELSLNPDNPHILRHASACQARLDLDRADLNAVSRWADSQEPELNLIDVPDFWSEIPYLTLVRLRIAQREIDEIPGLLERLSRKVESENRTGSLIEILILQSIALQAQGELDQALTKLERALSLAEPEGYVRTFIDEGEPMVKLLRLAASRGIARDYVKRLSASFRVGTESQPSVSSADGAVVPSSLVKPISKRELQVLKLIADGMSNREIAENLIIGDGTVKTHINNIYAKLDVQSRTQAVARARELKLI